MQKNRPYGPVDALTAAFHTRQKGQLEDIYRRHKFDAHTIGTRYINPGLKGLKGLDAGKAVGETLSGFPILDGNAPIVALALWLHGLTEKDMKKVPITEEFMPYKERALELVTTYKSKFLPLAKQVGRECEYVPNARDGNYRYYLETDQLVREFGTLTGNEELRRMLILTWAIDDATKLGNLGRVRVVQKEERTEGEIAVLVRHVLAQMMEHLRYHQLAQEMYNNAFRVLEPQLFEHIHNMVEKAGYVKAAAKSIERQVRAITDEITVPGIKISVYGRESGVKSEFSFFRKIIRKKAEEAADREFAEQVKKLEGEGKAVAVESMKAQEEARKNIFIERCMKEYGDAPLAEKKMMLENAMESAYDLIGFRLILTGPAATPEMCKAIGETLKFRTVFTGKEADYVTNKKSNGYSSFHLTSMFDGLYAEMQISTKEMDEINNGELSVGAATNHAVHKRNMTAADLLMVNELLSIEHFLGSPRLDSLDLGVELYELTRRGKAKCMQSISTETMKGIRVYDLGFIGYKIQKEMEMRDLIFPGFTARKTADLERAIGDAKRVRVLARLLKEPDAMRYRLMEAPHVFPKK